MNKITASTPQELFDFAIASKRTCISEYGGRFDSWELWRWAQAYAAANDLVAPSCREAYGIYNGPDEDEIAELRAEGIVVPAHMAETDPWNDHKYCVVCRECITCALRPCRDGGEHTLIEAAK